MVDDENNAMIGPVPPPPPVNAAVVSNVVDHESGAGQAPTPPSNTQLIVPDSIPTDARREAESKHDVSTTEAVTGDDIDYMDFICEIEVPEKMLEVTERPTKSSTFVAFDKHWGLVVFPLGHFDKNHIGIFIEYRSPGQSPYFTFTINLMAAEGVPNAETLTMSEKITQHLQPKCDVGFKFVKYNPEHHLNPVTRLIRVRFGMNLVPVVTKLSSHWADYRKNTGYVGLNNQGATCYMNSLLQTLYHLPLFAQAVYLIPSHRKESEGDKRRAIALALQRVFYALQTSDRAANTEELTSSFGWDSADAFTQHDVQEFNRVLMDAVEAQMKGTDMDGQVNKLFEGRTQNYIECTNVPYKSNRSEVFLDLQLNVQHYTSVYKSLENYVEVELMEGENKYRAGDHGLQEARRGTRFVKFPPVLSLQLKRFEFDYQHDVMVKVNDKFEFPVKLDLTRFLEEEVLTKEEAEKKKAAEGADENGADGDVQMKEADEASGKKKPLIYHLHSVLVHSGNVHGGHYYSFVRPLIGQGEQKYEDCPWFKFDDDHVKKVDKAVAVDANFGDGTPTSRSLRMASAYMLVYIADELIQDLGRDQLNELAASLTEEREEMKKIKVEKLAALRLAEVEAEKKRQDAEAKAKQESEAAAKQAAERAKIDAELAARNKANGIHPSGTVYIPTLIPTKPKPISTKPVKKELTAIEKLDSLEYVVPKSLMQFFREEKQREDEAKQKAEAEKRLVKFRMLPETLLMGHGYTPEDKYPNMPDWLRKRIGMGPNFYCRTDVNNLQGFELPMQTFPIVELKIDKAKSVAEWNNESTEETKEWHLPPNARRFYKMTFSKTPRSFEMAEHLDHFLEHPIETVHRRDMQTGHAVRRSARQSRNFKMTRYFVCDTRMDFEHEDLLHFDDWKGQHAAYIQKKREFDAWQAERKRRMYADSMLRVNARPRDKPNFSDYEGHPVLALFKYFDVQTQKLVYLGSGLFPNSASCRSLYEYSDRLLEIAKGHRHFVQDNETAEGASYKARASVPVSSAAQTQSDLPAIRLYQEPYAMRDGISPIKEQLVPFDAKLKLKDRQYWTNDIFIVSQIYNDEELDNMELKHAELSRQTELQRIHFAQAKHSGQPTEESQDEDSDIETEADKQMETNEEEVVEVGVKRNRPDNEQDVSLKSNKKQKLVKPLAVSRIFAENGHSYLRKLALRRVITMNLIQNPDFVPDGAVPLGEFSIEAFPNDTFADLLGKVAAWTNCSNRFLLRIRTRRANTGYLDSPVDNNTAITLREMFPKFWRSKNLREASPIHSATWWQEAVRTRDLYYDFDEFDSRLLVNNLKLEISYLDEEYVVHEGLNVLAPKTEHPRALFPILREKLNAVRTAGLSEEAKAALVPLGRLKLSMTLADSIIVSEMRERDPALPVPSPLPQPEPEQEQEKHESRATVGAKADDSMEDEALSRDASLSRDVSRGTSPQRSDTESSVSSFGANHDDLISQGYADDDLNENGRHDDSAMFTEDDRKHRMPPAYPDHSMTRSPSPVPETVPNMNQLHCQMEHLEGHLRVEQVDPEEEAYFRELQQNGPEAAIRAHGLPCWVYNFSPTPARRYPVGTYYDIYGEACFMMLRLGETVAEFRIRCGAKMHVSESDSKKLKIAKLQQHIGVSPMHPGNKQPIQYLSDTEVILQEGLGDWDRYLLGVENKSYRPRKKRDRTYSTPTNIGSLAIKIAK